MAVLVSVAFFYTGTDTLLWDLPGDVGAAPVSLEGCERPLCLSLSGWHALAELRRKQAMRHPGPPQVANTHSRYASLQTSCSLQLAMRTRSHIIRHEIRTVPEEVMATTRKLGGLGPAQPGLQS